MTNWALTATRVFTALACVSAAPLAARADSCEPFQELTLRLEENRTDGDGEIVLVAKGDEVGLSRLSVTAPNRRRFEVRGPRDNVGLLQFTLESAEPTNLQDLFDSFPAGSYEVRGTTVEGDCLRGSATLSLTPAPAPTIVTPADSSAVPVDAFVVSWSAVAGAAGYLVELTDETTGQVLRADMDAASTAFEVPPSWLVVSDPYEVTVAAKASSTGNVAGNAVLVTAAP